MEVDNNCWPTEPSGDLPTPANYPLCRSAEAEANEQLTRRHTAPLSSTCGYSKQVAAAMYCTWIEHSMR